MPVKDIAINIDGAHSLLISEVDTPAIRKKMMWIEGPEGQFAHTLTELSEASDLRQFIEKWLGPTK